MRIKTNNPIPYHTAEHYRSQKNLLTSRHAKARTVVFCKCQKKSPKALSLFNEKGQHIPSEGPHIIPITKYLNINKEPVLLCDEKK